MKIVIDTNALLVAVSRKSPFHGIFKAILNEKVDVYVTTDIVFEYEEILKKHIGVSVTENILRVLEEAPNVHWITKYYRWGLISTDDDDNKFVDCAIASDTNYLVTNDKHFDILKSIEFPKLETITAENFISILNLKKTK